MKLIRYTSKARWGDMAQEETAVVWQSEGCRFKSHPGRVEVSLSETPNPQLLLTSWLVPCMAANRRWCMNGWMRGMNCKALWIKALYKCSPFTFKARGEDHKSWLKRLVKYLSFLGDRNMLQC